MSTQDLLMSFSLTLLAAVMANFMIKDPKQYQKVVLSIMAKLSIMGFKLFLLTSLLLTVIFTQFPSFSSELMVLIWPYVIKYEADLNSYFLLFMGLNIFIYLSLKVASQIDNDQPN
jgi:hypothetical protein